MGGVSHLSELEKASLHRNAANLVHQYGTGAALIFLQLAELAEQRSLKHRPAFQVDSHVDDATITHLARVAYDAYGKVTGNKNYQGNPMPDFDELGETIQNAWRAAACSIVELVITEAIQRVKAIPTGSAR